MHNKKAYNFVLYSFGGRGRQRRDMYVIGANIKNVLHGNVFYFILFYFVLKTVKDQLAIIKETESAVVEDPCEEFVLCSGIYNLGAPHFPSFPLPHR